MAGDGTRSRALGLDPIVGTAPGCPLIFQALDQTAKWKVQALLMWLRQGKMPPRHGLYGIPDDLRVKVFEPFYTAWKQSRGHAGMGLTMAQEVAISHGGSIEIDRHFVGGCTPIQQDLLSHSENRVELAAAREVNEPSG